MATGRRITTTIPLTGLKTEPASADEQIIKPGIAQTISYGAGFDAEAMRLLWSDPSGQQAVRPNIDWSKCDLETSTGATTSADVDIAPTQRTDLMLYYEVGFLRVGVVSLDGTAFEGLFPPEQIHFGGTGVLSVCVLKVWGRYDTYRFQSADGANGTYFSTSIKFPDQITG